MESTFIYALCEPGTRTVRYIGKANNLKRRLRAHLGTSVSMNTHLGCWLKGLLFRGEKPSLIVLREVPKDQWQIAEERYIRLARGLGMKLVNCSDGGDGVTFTPEVRAKMSASHKGVRFSPERRAASARATTGQKRTPEQCANIGRVHKGKKASPELLKKMSEAMRGEKNPNFGRPRPLETRLKISASNTGQKRSLESREKMRVSALAFHARKAAQV